MLLASSVDVALGWAYHTVYRAKRHWTLKKEGALVAAAVVMAFGIADTARSFRPPSPTPAEAPAIAVNVPAAEAPLPLAQPTPAITATATPVVTETTPIQILPIEDPVQTIAAAPSPAPEVDPEVDPIGAKITERLGDVTATGSIAPKPAKTVKTVKVAGSKPKKPAKGAQD